FFSMYPPTPSIYTFSLHDALPIFHQLNRDGEALDRARRVVRRDRRVLLRHVVVVDDVDLGSLEAVRVRAAGRVPRRVADRRRRQDRKSTRLNSSHVAISYAVFCLK